MASPPLEVLILKTICTEHLQSSAYKNKGQEGTYRKRFSSIEVMHEIPYNYIAGYFQGCKF